MVQYSPVDIRIHHQSAADHQQIMHIWILCQNVLSGNISFSRNQDQKQNEVNRCLFPITMILSIDFRPFSEWKSENFQNVLSGNGGSGNHRMLLELQHKIQKSRPWMRSPSSPLTTWGAWSTGAKLPPPSEADSYNSSSIKVIFVTPTFLPQFIFISFLFLYNDNIQTPEVSGPSCQWPWDRWIWMQSETVGFYFLETHLSPGSECLSPSLQ